jgi:colicin import membrane protein
MQERASYRWIAITLSVLLHGGVVALLGYGFLTWQKRPPPTPAMLAIEATVIDADSLKGVRQPQRKPPPPPPEPEPEPEPAPEPPPEEPPKPTPEEVQQEQERQLQEQQRVEQEKRLAEEKRVAEEKRLAEEKRVAQERAETERKAKELEAKRRAEEDAKRKADEKRREEERLAAERESDLQRQLAEEERLNAARSSGAMATWIQQIQARIQRAWIRPASARPGIECVLYVTQIPGGEIVNVRLGACNGDQAVRESIEAAAFRASPLPPPPDPALFERNLIINFRPVD